MSFSRVQFQYMNPYDIHKAIINEYVLRRPGDTKLLKRDTSNDKTDADIIKENHKFLWNENNESSTWEQQFAKRYYDKLFKEYCIGDLSRYKENKIALRWRTEQEVMIGRGQFTCGNKKCNEKPDLKTWEVNFGYIEEGQKQNALVKIRLCPDCSKKLNYHSKKREVKRIKHNKTINSEKRKYKSKDDAGTSNIQCSSKTSENDIEIEHDNKQEQDIAPKSSDNQGSHWSSIKAPDIKSRDEEMEEYLQDLLL